MPRHGCRAAALRAAWRLAFGVASAFASDVGGNALVLAWSAAARAEWLLDVDAGARYDSNLTRAQERPDVRSDAAATLFASAGTFFALTGADGLTLDVNALTEAWHRFHGLNRASIGGAASYKHKFGLDYAAPWISLGFAGSHDNYRGAIPTQTASKRAPSWASASMKRSMRQSVPSSTGGPRR